MSEALITTDDLSVHFPLRGGKLFGPPPVVRAVEGVAYRHAWAERGIGILKNELCALTILPHIIILERW